MEKPDFQVGDKVTCLIYGEGVISAIYYPLNNFIYPIHVSFKNYIDPSLPYYTIEGQLDMDANRTLYHGHNLKITVEEKRPKRWPWVNVYRNQNGCVYAGTEFVSKEDALRNSRTVPYASYNYSHTIQLAPPQDEEHLSKGDKFIKHIQQHLMPGEKVICKICGKTVDEICQLKPQEEE